MSHFTVLCKISDERVKRHGGAEEALSAMLVPYQENNMGDCPGKFLEFHDETDEHMQEYENETCKIVVLPSGERVGRYDARFKVKTRPDDSFSPVEYPVPDDCQEVVVPLKERYSTFSAFMEDYHGATPEPDGTYGYYENPNAKWDWYAVGGRWSGYFPVKGGAGHLGTHGVMDSHLNAGPGYADICQVADLDTERILAEAKKGLDGFCERWQQYNYGRGPRDKADPFRFDRCRSFALKYEILTCKGEAELAGDEWLAVPWAVREGDEDKPKRFDVWAGPVTAEDIRTKYCDYFAPLRTFAVLDEEGWHASGTMGWWACVCDESAESANDYAEGWFERFIKTEKPNTWLAVVDCHI